MIVVINQAAPRRLRNVDDRTGVFPNVVFIIGISTVPISLPEIGVGFELTLDIPIEAPPPPPSVYGVTVGGEANSTLQNTLGTDQFLNTALVVSYESANGLVYVGLGGTNVTIPANGQVSFTISGFPTTNTLVANGRIRAYLALAEANGIVPVTASGSINAVLVPI